MPSLVKKAKTFCSKDCYSGLRVSTPLTVSTRDQCSFSRLLLKGGGFVYIGPGLLLSIPRVKSSHHSYSFPWFLENLSEVFISSFSSESQAVLPSTQVRSPPLDIEVGLIRPLSVSTTFLWSHIASLQIIMQKQNKVCKNFFAIFMSERSVVLLGNSSKKFNVQKHVSCFTFFKHNHKKVLTTFKYYSISYWCCPLITLCGMIQKSDRWIWHQIMVWQAYYLCRLPLTRSGRVFAFLPEEWLMSSVVWWVQVSPCTAAALKHERAQSTHTHTHTHTHLQTERQSKIQTILDMGN